jgi:hypothetical protein
MPHNGETNCSEANGSLEEDCLTMAILFLNVIVPPCADIYIYIMFDKGSLSRAFEDTEAGLLGETKLIKKVGEHMSVARQNNNAKGPTVYQLTHTHTQCIRKSTLHGRLLPMVTLIRCGWKRFSTSSDQKTEKMDRYLNI